MSLRENLPSLANFISKLDTLKRDAKTTKQQRESIELLEQRIMFSATQAGAFFDGCLDHDNMDYLGFDNNLEELFSGSPEHSDEIANLVNELFSGNEAPVDTVADDIIKGTSGDDDIDGTAADETITGRQGNDHLHGQGGDDVVRGGTGNDVVEGNSGNDIVKGGAGNDAVYGGSGNDMIFGGRGNDILNGGGGDEMLSGGAGHDIIDGGTGYDTVHVDGNSTDYKVEASDKGGFKITGIDGSVAEVTNIEEIAFLWDKVNLKADDLANIANPPVVEAPIVEAPVVEAPVVEAPMIETPVVEVPVVEAPVDTVADDIIKGTSGDDDIDGTAADETITGRQGNDHLHGQGGDDVVRGGTGNDVVEGNSGNDIVKGGAGNDAVYGGPGNDMIFGGRGNDILNGGGGDEMLSGGAGHDIIDGGTGYDTVHVDGNSTDYKVEASDKGGFKITGIDGSVAEVTNIEEIAFLWDKVNLKADDLANIANGKAPVVEAPIVEAPVVEAPVVEAPVVEAPVVEAPVVEAPIVEAPVVEAPVVEAPIVEAPVVETPVVETPVVEAPAAQPTYVVEVINGTNTEFFATPVWFGLHDGSFDLFDAGSSASNALEVIAELGDVNPLTAAFEAAPGTPGDINGVVRGGATGIPPISPGETGTGSFEVINPANYQYFSFASMVIPSNDTFIGNDNALEYRIFDDNGNFLGNNGVFEIQVTNIYDAGTEINDGSANGGGAFIAGADEFGGAAENGVVTRATDLSEFQGVNTPNGLTINDTTLGAGESFATIRIIEVPAV